jgi:DNA-directed RNA polymerase subunit RPC12/RpoP
MTNEENDYQNIMTELRESIAPEDTPFLNEIDKFVGELRRQSGDRIARIEELRSTASIQQGKVDNLVRSQDRIAALERAIANGKKELKKLAVYAEDLQWAMLEWEEIDEENSGFINIKVKCLECGLHFILCTEDDPDQHTAETIHCPECGQHGESYIVWR